MGRYRNVQVKIYGDEKFLALSRPQPNAQTLFVYLLTGPETTSLPGVLRVGQAALAESLEWDLERFREPFLELVESGMVKADLKARLILLPNGLKFNPPDNPNVVKGWGKVFESLPECELKDEIFQHVRASLETLSEPFKEAFRKGFGTVPKRLPNTVSSEQLAVSSEQEEEERARNSAQTEPLDIATSTLDASSSKSNRPHEIEVYKAVTRRLPPSTSWPRVCLLFKGKETDELLAYFVEWRARGYLAKNIGWLDWVEAGEIPTRSRGSPQVKGHDPVTEKLMREFEAEEAANAKQGGSDKGDDAIDAKFSRLAKGTG